MHVSSRAEAAGAAAGSGLHRLLLPQEVQGAVALTLNGRQAMAGCKQSQP